MESHPSKARHHASNGSIIVSAATYLAVRF